MKLSNTITDHRIATNTKLNYVCGNYVCEKHIDKSIQELFIESVYRSNIIDEGQLDAAAAWIKSLTSQIQAASAPKQASDLAALLKFVAPNGGGIKSIENLIRTAKQSPGNILNNTQWWDGVFNSFGIADEPTRREVLKKFKALQNPQIAPPQANQPQANQPTDQPTTQASPTDQLRDTIAQHADYNTKIAGLNTKIKTEIQARRAELLKRIQELQAQQAAASPKTKKTTPPVAPPAKKRLRVPATVAPAESTIAIYARLLLEFPQIKANLPAIAKTMVPLNGEHIVIREDGIMERTRRTVGGGGLLNKIGQVGRTIGQIATKPGQAKSKFQATSTANNNERIAKEVIKTLTDIQRQKLTEHLKTKKIQPQQIANDLAKLKQYQQKQQSGTPLSPQEQQDFTATRQKLASVRQQFSPSGSKPPVVSAEKPVEAEIVPEPTTTNKRQPVDAEAMATSGKLISYLEQKGLSPKDVKWLRDRPQLKPGQILKMLKDYRNLTGVQVARLTDKFNIKWD